MGTTGQHSDLPPPFVVGQKYADRVGEYTVISVAGDVLTIEYADGRRTQGTVAMKAKIHRGVLEDRLFASVRTGIPRHGTLPTTLKRDRMLLAILRLETDGLDHTGVEIDKYLRDMASDLGYTDLDLANKHVNTGRGVFANDGDWAKAELTHQEFHQVVGTHSHVEASGQHRSCKVYRITDAGLREVQRRSETTA